MVNSGPSYIVCVAESRFAIVAVLVVDELDDVVELEALEDTDEVAVDEVSVDAVVDASVEVVLL